MRSRSLSVSLPHHSFALPRICFHLPSRMSLLIGQSSYQIIELVTSQWTGACSYAARVTLTRCASDHRPSSGVRELKSVMYCVCAVQGIVSELTPLLIRACAHSFPTFFQNVVAHGRLFFECRRT